MKWNYYKPKFEYEEKFNDFYSAWAGHKFFAYDLIRNFKPKKIVELGTHKGTSFFSLCQSVKDGEFDSELNAVDTWNGDEHAGFYGEEVFDGVKDIKEGFYNDLNLNLIRKLFDDALPDFEDESIDLLHIDGLHTYEAVKHDFESWLPKVKKEGVILFHDICERNNGFGVYKLWEELKKKYSTLEFHHSHGLGVVFLSSEKFADMPIFEEIWRNYYEFFNDNVVLMNEKKNVEIKLGDGQCAVKQKDEVIAWLNEVVTQKDEVIAWLNEVVEQKDSEVAGLNGFVRVKEGEVGMLNETIEGKNNLIFSLEKGNDAIRKSLSYKMGRGITWPLRVVYNFSILTRRRLNGKCASHSSNLDKKALSNFKLAVVLHIYYDDFLEEIIDSLKNIPVKFDIYISTRPEIVDKIRNIFSDSFIDYGVFVEGVCNSGYDIGPFICWFGPIASKYDFVCKIHAKKSIHNPEVGLAWRKYLFANLLGSSRIVCDVLIKFAQNEKLGMVFPEFFPLLVSHLKNNFWGNNFKISNALANRLGVKLKEERRFDFSAGSMFWFRPESLSNLFDLGLNYSDFEESSVAKVDGTLAHAMERLFPLIVEHNGLTVEVMNF